MTFDEDSNSPACPEAESPDVEPDSSPAARRWLLTSAAVAVTAVAGITGAHAASAANSERALDTPQPTVSGFDAALWQRQELLSDLRHWITTQPGIEDSGYVTSVNDPDTGSTTLVWHGPPDRMQQQILDEARRRGIPVSLRACKYSLADLERAAEQLNAIESGTGVFQNFSVDAIGTFGIDVTFDGVSVNGEYIHPPAEGIAAADNRLAQVLTARTGVTVAIEHVKIELL
jgi:hypothetical protein